MLHPVHQQLLRHQHELVVQLFRRTPSSGWKSHPDEGKWSLHEQLAHLARYQQIFLERMEQLLKQDGIAFDRYSPEGDEIFPSFIRKSTPALLESLLSSRSAIIAFAGSLSESQWAQKGVHPLLGPMNTAEWFEFFLSHESHHIFSMFKLSRRS